MKRLKTNKKPKMKRGAKLSPFIHKPIINPWGGHLPFPPEDCRKPEQQFVNKGVTWIDLSICHSCPVVKECNRRREYLKTLKRT